MNKFDQLSAWILFHVGETFKVGDDGVFETYIGSDGIQRPLKASGAKDSEALIAALKNYIDVTQGDTLLPQVEFSNDYKKFKIYWL